MGGEVVMSEERQLLHRLSITSTNAVELFDSIARSWERVFRRWIAGTAHLWMTL